MLKLTCLVLLVTVAISWSQVDAGISPRAFPPRKRQVSSAEFKGKLADEVKHLTGESQQRFAKELLASRLLTTINLDDSGEVDRLSLAFLGAINKNYNSMDEYIDELLRIYEEVIGRKPYANNKSK